MDKRMSLDTKKCAYSQNFPPKDGVSKRHKLTQGQKLVTIRMSSGEKGQKSAFLFHFYFAILICY